MRVQSINIMIQHPYLETTHSHNLLPQSLTRITSTYRLTRPFCLYFSIYHGAVVCCMLPLALAALQITARVSILSSLKDRQEG